MALEVAMHLPLGTTERTNWLVEAGQCFLAEGQGLTLVHFLAQRKRFLWDGGSF